MTIVIDDLKGVSALIQCPNVYVFVYLRLLP
jgi:hypothetical protein